MTAQKLCFTRQDTKILKDVSFQIQAGSFTTIIGPNGAGKSTLLKIILGELNPDKGAIEWHDGRRIGYMPQTLPVDRSFPLSVGRLFDLKPASVNAQDRDKIQQLTETGHLTQRLISDLSGGELQRVLLAYALLGDPDLLLLDEPMQGLDVDSELTFLNILQALKYDYAKTIVMVSHDLHLVFKHSDHVICLHQHVCCQGSPASVQDNPAYHILFGKQQENLMTIYAHRHDHHHGDSRHD